MNKQQMIELLTDLDAVPGISGYEQDISARIAGHLDGYVDESYNDVLGNLILVKKGKDPDYKVMLSAHMDEIGFMVSDITDNGYIILLPVGFHDARMLLNQVLTVHTRRGGVQGVTGAGAPPHVLKGKEPAAFTFADIRLDIGAYSRAEAEEMGVAIGDTVTNRRGSRVMGNVFCGNAVDNRVGCAVMIAAMQALKDIQTDATIYACASVQEELGVKGAQVLAHAIRPTVSIALDVCFGALDDTIDHNGTRAFLGKGPAIQLYDWSPGSLLGHMVPPKLKDRMIATAQKEGIPYQLEVTLNGGTDAAEIALAGNGALSGCVNVPNRYVHSAVGTVDIQDCIHAAKLVEQFLAGLNKRL